MGYSKAPLILLVFLLFFPLDGPYSAEVVVDQAEMNPYVSFRFLQSSQNIPDNANNSLSDIYYSVGILNLTGRMDLLGQDQKDGLVAMVRSFQNTDGGFGDWYNDRSKASSTKMAVDVLSMLGSSPENVTGLVGFLGRLQVSGLEYGNYGFRSSLKDRDADLSSTYSAISTLQVLGHDVPNLEEVEFYVRDHQNFDGGFGYQTNRRSNVTWTSDILQSNRGLMALDAIGAIPDFFEPSFDYLDSLQDVSGGFSKDGDLGEPQVAYTNNAVEALLAWDRAVPRKDQLVHFIVSNQLDNGGYLENELDLKDGPHTTYFAIRTLSMLGEEYDPDLVSRYALAWAEGRLDGGFGDYPGLGSNMRYTYDAVSALNLIGREPLEREAAVDFILSLRNEDGGFGEGGASNVETTSRAVMALQLLGEPILEPDKVVGFLVHGQNNDGGFGFAHGYVSRGAYTYRTLRALDMLGARPLDTDGAIRYLRSLQNPDGGFGNYFGEDDSDLTSTYRAIRGLAILGAAPTNPYDAREFIVGSRNEDGGFRRSPMDVTLPGNLSTSLYTYDGVLGLNFLGEPLDDYGPTLSYIKALRDPDLGFSSKVYFTSSVSDTFTSLWTYFYLVPSNSSVSIGPIAITEGDEAGLWDISAKVEDTLGRRPERVHVLVDGVRRFMAPSKGWNYTASLPLSPGNHSIQIEADDGIVEYRSEVLIHKIESEGPTPKLRVDFDPDYGLPETVFELFVEVDTTGSWTPEKVQVRIDTEDWVDADISGGSYVVRTPLRPGNHQIVARGVKENLTAYSESQRGPLVYASNVSRPNWETFLRIRDTVYREESIRVHYLNVTRSVLDGRVVWKVTEGERTVFVTNDGGSIVEAGSDSGRDGRVLLPFIAVVSLLLVLIAFHMVYMRYIRKKGDRG